jgi:hypothetical protein
VSATPRRNNNAGLGKIPAENFRDLIGARSRSPRPQCAVFHRYAGAEFNSRARALAVPVGFFVGP